MAKTVIINPLAVRRFQKLEGLKSVIIYGKRINLRDSHMA